MDDVINGDGGTSAIINPPFTSKINNHVLINRQSKPVYP